MRITADQTVQIKENGELEDLTIETIQNETHRKKQKQFSVASRSSKGVSHRGELKTE